MKLKIGQGLTLPLDAVTETFAILGRRGSGKTHTAVVMAEEMLGAGVPVVVLDPLDVWWGLRVSKDGKAAGFPIYVAGGSHADIPLLPDAGKVIADAVVDKGLSIVLSVRHLSKTDQRRFVGEFCERLYDRKADPKHRTAVHVFIDEADAFVPQRLLPGGERCYGAVDTMVRRGRSSGLAITLISQRPQVIAKDVLSQTEVLVAHQLTGPQDRKALDAWVEANDTEDRRGEFMASLASLPKGTAWFWSPGLLGIFKRVEVRDRHTFDSSATPKAGVSAVASPKAFAAVDLEKLTAEIAATIAKAKTENPAELRKEIVALRRELDAAKKAQPAAVETKTVEKFALKDGQLARAEKLIERLDGIRDVFRQDLQQIVTEFGERVQEAERINQEVFSSIRTIANEIAGAIATTAPRDTPTLKGNGHRVVPSVTTARPVAVPATRRAPTGGRFAGGMALACSPPTADGSKANCEEEVAKSRDGRLIAILRSLRLLIEERGYESDRFAQFDAGHLCAAETIIDGELSEEASKRYHDEEAGRKLARAMGVSPAPAPPVAAPVYRSGCTDCAGRDGEHEAGCPVPMLYNRMAADVLLGREDADSPVAAPGAQEAAIEFSQHLIRKTLEMNGCSGLRAQVDETTCLVAYPVNPHEWCPACLMTRAGEILIAPDASLRSERVEQSLKAGQLLGPAFDGASLVEIAQEVVRLRSERDALREQIAALSQQWKPRAVCCCSSYCDCAADAIAELLAGLDRIHRTLQPPPPDGEAR